VLEPVSWSVSVVLIVFVAVHILEEALKGFRTFFNTEWFGGTRNCPVGRFKGVVIDQIGLFVLIACLAVGGALIDGRWILVAVGVVMADLVQHSVFSLAKRGYTPGIATCGLYLFYLVYFFAQVDPYAPTGDVPAWLAMATGASMIVANYILASKTFWRSRNNNEVGV